MTRDPNPIWAHPDGRLLLLIFAGLSGLLVSLAVAFEYLVLS
jgi:hypothetical protein